MKIFQLLLIAAVFFSVPLAFASSHLSSDPRVTEAREFYQERKFDAALEILRPLAGSHPDQTDVLFLIGISAIEASKNAPTRQEKNALLKEATAALRKILLNRPSLVRVRLELARAFFLKGDYDLAKRHFDQALAGHPPPAVIANIRRFLEKMRAGKRWSGYIGFTIAPDTNFNTASDEETIHLNFFGYLLPFTLDDPGEKSGVGILAWGGGEYQHPISRRRALRIGTDIFLHQYEGKRFDQIVFSWHIGPRLLLGKKSELSILTNFRQRQTGEDTTINETGFRLEGYSRISRRIRLRTRAQVHRRDYIGSDSLDGPSAEFSLSPSWLITSVLRADLTAGAGYERPQNQIWRNKTRWGKIGFALALPLGFTLGANAERHWIDYEGAYFSGGEDRSDRLRIFRISVFNRGFTIKGISPQIVLVNEKRSSNSQLQSYSRNRAEIRFVRQF